MTKSLTTLVISFSQTATILLCGVEKSTFPAPTHKKVATNLGGESEILGGGEVTLQASKPCTEAKSGAGQEKIFTSMACTAQPTRGVYFILSIAGLSIRCYCGKFHRGLPVD